MPSLKIDLHVHTSRSDSSSAIEEILGAARKRGLDGVAITDHGTARSWTSASRPTSDLLIIPGLEVTTKSGHLLVLGMKNPPPKGLDPVAVSEYAKRKGGVVIVPHPNIPFLSVGEDVIERIRPDVIETYNAKIPFERIIKKNVKLAERLGIPQTGGSDSHTHKTVGDMYTVVEVEDRSVEAVLDAIRRGEVRPAGKMSTWLEKADIVFRMVVSKLKFWRDK